MPSIMASVALIGATTLASNLTSTSLLPPGTNAPRPGATCGASSTALGTSNVSGSGRATSAVNVWVIQRTSDDATAGYIVKAENGSLWYEPPLRGLNYEPLDEVSIGVLAHQAVRFVGCFTSDLPGSYFSQS